jgi:peroxiredoxin
MNFIRIVVVASTLAHCSKPDGDSASVASVQADELAKMKGFGIDLESYSEQTHHKIAIPALFLIDRTGVVRWAHSDPEFKMRPSTTQILAAIDGKMDEVQK